MAGVLPEIRAEMQRAADDMLLTESDLRELIHSWIPRMIRRAPARKAPIRKVRSRAEIEHDKQLIRACAAANPEMNYQEIAFVTGVRNIGRVSECLAGFP